MPPALQTLAPSPTANPHVRYVLDHTRAQQDLPLIPCSHTEPNLCPDDVACCRPSTRNSLITMLLYTDALVGDELISDAYDVSQSPAMWIPAVQPREREQRGRKLARFASPRLASPRAKAASPRRQQAGDEALGTRTRVRAPRWSTRCQQRPRREPPGRAACSPTLTSNPVC